MVKHTFALAGRPTFNLSAARSTLVAVRFAVRAAHRLIELRTTTRSYAINQTHGINAFSWHDTSHAVSNNEKIIERTITEST